VGAPEEVPFDNGLEPSFEVHGLVRFEGDSVKEGLVDGSLEEFAELLVGGVRGSGGGVDGESGLPG
jgi:hypothetical protein